MTCPDFSDILDQLRNPINKGYAFVDVSYDEYEYDYSHMFHHFEYKFPYDLINCDSECKKKLNYKKETGERPNPFVKKNENILEESKNSTNKSYMFLYIWFILMVIVIYVFIIAIVSDNSYHPLMNVIIFIFLVYLSYYMFRNLYKIT